MIRINLLGQGGVRTHVLSEHRHAVGERSDRWQLDFLRRVRLDFERVGHIRVAAGHHQREILNHVHMILWRLGIIKTGQRIDVHTPSINGDPIFLRAWLFEEYILDVVDHVIGGAHRVVNAWPDVVAIKDLLRFIVLSQFTITGLSGAGGRPLAKR